MSNAKKCLFCSKDKKHVSKIVKVLMVIRKYEEEELFLNNFILGDWEDQPLEVIRLIKKLKLVNPTQHGE